MIIKIYKVENCGLCDYIGDKVKTMIKGKDITFSSYVVSKPAYADKFPDIKTVPAVVVDDVVLHGKYLVKELRALLEA